MSAGGGVRALNDNTGRIEILLVRSSLCGTSLVSLALFNTKCRQMKGGLLPAKNWKI